MDGFLNAVVAKRAGIKKVIVHSHSTSTLYHPLLHRAFRPLLRKIKIYRFACSDLAGQWLFGRGAEYRIIRNGVDINTFSYSASNREKVRLENGWKNHTVIGHVGSMTYPKNHEFILDVFSEYIKINPNAILVLVGDGPLRASVEEKIEKLNLGKSIFLMGSRSDIYNLDQGMDLFLFPSLYDNAPLVVREAAALHTPSLLIKGSTSAEVIHDSVNGFLSDNSVTAYASRISQLLETPQLIAEAGEAASHSIARSWEDVAEEVYDRYVNLIHRSGN